MAAGEAFLLFAAIDAVLVFIIWLLLQVNNDKG